jgi:predicted acyltransferase (DUF342 family)
MITAVALLALLTGSLLSLPLAPALLELRLHKDAGPIPIEDNAENIADLARRFRALLRDHRAAARRARPRGTAQVFEHDALLHEGMFFADYIYAKGNLVTGGSNVFHAILCDKDVHLGEHSKVLGWLHATGTAVLGEGSLAYGRLSAGERVEIGPGCNFERVHAPIVTISGGSEAMGLDRAYREEGRFLERVTDRIVVHKDFTLAAAEFLRSNVVAGRRIHLAEHSQVTGNLKSNSAMWLESNVRIDGSLVSASDLRIGTGCLILGPVLAEGELLIESGTQIGLPQHPTTVRALRIRIAGGVSIHGSLWACEQGQVRG